MIRRLSLLLVLTLSLLAALTTSAGADSAAPPTFQPPRNYYLSLGDSVAFGFQRVVFDAGLASGEPASAFDHGYTDDFAARLAEIRPGIQTVNLACPQETTVTMVAGGCAYAAAYPLHAHYQGAQLAAALAFLAAHRGRVSPVTFSIGGNDEVAFVASCHFDPACIAAGIPQFATALAARIGGILASIRAAAPDAELIVLRGYNPYAVVDPSTNQAAEVVNLAVAQTAAASQARIADAYTPFNLAPEEPQTLCALTWFCTPLADNHPNDAGYRVIADAFFAASGYARLPARHP
jgi:lysophospholipase L1-like esterase